MMLLEPGYELTRGGKFFRNPVVLTTAEEDGPTTDAPSPSLLF